MGRVRLMRPKRLALMVVQRQTAASRSARPLRRGQQGSFGGVPTLRLSKFRRFKQTPSFRVSLGQEPEEGEGVGLGLGLGLGL